MMARYEKDDEIEKALTMIWKDEYKDDGSFNPFSAHQFIAQRLHQAQFLVIF